MTGQPEAQDTIETSVLPDVDLDWILQELDDAGRKLPERAILEARKHRDTIVPLLIEVLQSATRAARADETPEGDAPFFALFLLTEFQANEALPAIIDAASVSKDDLETLFGDALTEILPRTFASLAGDRIDLLETWIRDRQLYRSVRWGAADAFCYLVRDGRLSRAEAVERLGQHLREGIDNRDEEIAGTLVCVLSYLFPIESRTLISEAFERQLVELFLIAPEDIDRAIRGGENGMRSELSHFPPTQVDTLEELRHWAAFREEPIHRPLPPPRPPADFQARGPILSLSSLESLPEPSERAVRPFHVGRNDPCPCNSGKKFKKCCGSRKGRE